LANKACTKFNEHTDAVVEMHNADEENDKVFQKCCRKIVRELHKMPKSKTKCNGPVQRKKVVVLAPTPIDPSKRKKHRIVE